MLCGVGRLGSYLWIFSLPPFAAPEATTLRQPGREGVTVLAVDLAAKFSAVCLMDDDFTVLTQFDSFLTREDAFIYTIASAWMFASEHRTPEVMVVEDLPHGLKYSTLIKTVCRLQGRIVQAMHDDYTDILFLAPREWRSHYLGLERGTGPEAVVPVAAEFGYTPPLENLLTRAKGNGGKTKAMKVATDYCAAYLIARWAIETKRKYGTFDVPGTSRYDTREIRKKEFHAQDS